MIIAIIITDRTALVHHDKLPYELPAGPETVIERVARVVLRGPFGGTLLAAPTEYIGKIMQFLDGFAVQSVDVGSAAALSAEPHRTLIHALEAAAGFRARWEKAMTAAAAKFSISNEDEVEKTAAQKGPDPEDAEQGKSGAPATHLPLGKGSGVGWSKHRRSPDVKIRGLARSFERDGIILFRGERPLITPELQAQVVEAFGRDGTAMLPRGQAGKAAAGKTPSFEKISAPRPIAQSVYKGRRGYPVILSLDAAAEIQALPPAIQIDQWLLDNAPRVREVNVEDAGAVESIESAADYERIVRRIGGK